MKSLPMFVAVAVFVSLIVCGSSATQGTQNLLPSTRSLLVVAHPDDEYELAGTVYRIANELDGVVDQVIITDGEGGFRYSSLASRYYGVNLTDETVGRADLPHIREQEARAAAKVLGIHFWFARGFVGSLFLAFCFFAQGLSFCLLLRSTVGPAACAGLDWPAYRSRCCAKGP